MKRVVLLPTFLVLFVFISVSGDSNNMCECGYNAIDGSVILMCTGEISSMGQYNKCPRAVVVDFFDVHGSDRWERLNLHSFMPNVTKFQASYMSPYACRKLCASALYLTFRGNFTSNCGCPPRNDTVLASTTRNPADFSMTNTTNVSSNVVDISKESNRTAPDSSTSSVSSAPSRRRVFSIEAELRLKIRILHGDDD